MSLLLYMASALLLVGFFAEAAAGFSARAYAGSVLDLAGRSVLSEFDRNLLRDYGLFGMQTDGEAAKDRLRLYIGASLRSQSGKLDLFRLRMNDIRADVGAYTLVQPERLHEQIVQYMKPRAVEDGLNVLGIIGKGRADSGKTGTGRSVGAAAERKLGNRQIIDALPSHSVGGYGGLTEWLPTALDWNRLANATGRRLLLNLYICRQFRHHLSADFPHQTFFRNEIEYILAGQTGDQANRRLVLLSLMAVRTAINLVHLYEDSVKREEIIALATATAPGPALPAAIALIATAWAGFEAYSDVQRLLAGEGVPLVKTAADWRTGLTGAMAHSIELVPVAETGGSGRRSPSVSKEPRYEDYLLLLLCLKPTKRILFRVMDLIQLNMKGNYDRDFLFSRCYAGIEYRCRIERRSGYYGFSGIRDGEFLSRHEY